MKKRKNTGTSLPANGLIWFGAGISLAEIQAGMSFASLRMGRAWIAILTGHVIGCFFLFLAGCIGGSLKKKAMETAAVSFGEKGSVFFAFLNVLQLVGWTGIMIYDGALAANEIFGIGKAIWALILGALILLWILAGTENIGKLNFIPCAALLLLAVFLCTKVFQGQAADVPGNLSMGAAIELAAAMPLSWLPLISDYTKEAERPVAASLVSTMVYGTVSSFMYVIGCGGVLYTGEASVAAMILKVVPGFFGIVLVLLSTVTTTYLDAVSAGTSFHVMVGNLSNRQWIKRGEKLPRLAAACLGCAFAAAFPMDDITDFLYLIGSVFTPMVAVMITDHFILKNDRSRKKLSVIGFAVWVIGFVCYRVFLSLDLPVGYTLPDMVCTGLLAFAAGKMERM